MPMDGLAATHAANPQPNRDKPLVNFGSGEQSVPAHRASEPRKPAVSKDFHARACGTARIGQANWPRRDSRPIFEQAACHGCLSRAAGAKPAAATSLSSAPGLGEHVTPEQLTAHLRVDRYGDFLLTEAVRPSVDLQVVPREGFRIEIYRDKRARL